MPYTVKTHNPGRLRGSQFGLLTPDIRHNLCLDDAKVKPFLSSPDSISLYFNQRTKRVGNNLLSSNSSRAGKHDLLSDPSNFSFTNSQIEFNFKSELCLIEILGLVDTVVNFG